MSTQITIRTEYENKSSKTRTLIVPDGFWPRLLRWPANLFFNLVVLRAIDRAEEHACWKEQGFEDYMQRMRRKREQFLKESGLVIGREYFGTHFLGASVTGELVSVSASDDGIFATLRQQDGVEREDVIAASLVQKGLKPIFVTHILEADRDPGHN